MKIPPLPSLLALIALAGCAPAPTPSPAPSPATSADTVADTVALDEDALRLADFGVESATPAPFARTLPANGAVDADPADLAVVNSRVKAKVLEMRARVGDPVAAGDVVAVVESEDLHAAQVAHHLAEKKVRLAEDDLRRRQRLAALGAYGRPALEEARQRDAERRGDAESARADTDAAEAAVAEAEGTVAAREAALAQARTRQRAARAQATRADTLLREELIARQEWERHHADADAADADTDAAAASLAQSRAALRGARARADAAATRRDTLARRAQIASDTLRREERVSRDDLRTRQELADARAALEKARIERESARDDIELLGGQPGDMHSIPIHAPIAGRVVERSASLGQTVDMGTPLYTLFGGRDVWVRLSLPPGDAARVRPGMAVEVRSDAAPGRAFAGRVATVGEMADPQTRTVPVRCRLSPAAALRPGVFVTARISLGAPAPALSLPEEALRRVGGRTVVFVATDRPGAFRVVPVTVGAREAGRVRIDAGLRGGERVVVRNAALLQDRAEEGTAP